MSDLRALVLGDKFLINDFLADKSLSKVIKLFDRINYYSDGFNNEVVFQLYNGYFSRKNQLVTSYGSVRGLINISLLYLVSACSSVGKKPSRSEVKEFVNNWLDKSMIDYDLVYVEQYINFLFNRPRDYLMGDGRHNHLWLISHIDYQVKSFDKGKFYKT